MPKRPTPREAAFCVEPNKRRRVSPVRVDMRFSANQLRMLQEDLAPALPQLAPPPEMTFHVPAQLPAQQQQHHHHEPPPATKLSGAMLAPSYLACGAVGALHLALSPVSLALAWHALCAGHSRLAQAFGLCAALAWPLACAAPAFLPPTGLLTSVFLAIAAPGGPLRLACLTLLCCVAGLAVVAGSAEPGQARDAAVRVSLGILCVQAALSAARVRTFELICAVKPR